MNRGSRIKSLMWQEMAMHKTCQKDEIVDMAVG